MRAAEEGILLLCCRLGGEEKPLTPGEYRRLALRVLEQPRMREEELTVGTLRALGYDDAQAERIVRLLSRRARLRAYLAAVPEMRVLTRISPGFPTRLRVLGERCPAALFCLGDVSLPDSRAVALVGSRRLLPENRTFAARLGAQAAKEGLTLVSGDAVGADRSAQDACLGAGGRVVCFVPDELTRHIPRKNVLFCSAEGYDFPFSAPRALERNRYIHALAEKVFVAQSTLGAGGTWQGATDNLSHGYSPVFVYNDGSEAARALAGCGAQLLDGVPASLSNLSGEQLTIFDTP